MPFISTSRADRPPSFLPFSPRRLSADRLRDRDDDDDPPSRGIDRSDREV
jgi:hypothetical protein